MVAFYINGQRYAVGASGPVWWLDDAKWAPRWGWWPWLIAFAVGCLLLAFNIVNDARVRPDPTLGRPPTTPPDPDDDPATPAYPTDTASDVPTTAPGSHASPPGLTLGTVGPVSLGGSGSSSR